MNHSEWRSCSHESEVAGRWRNATDNGRRLRQPAEPTDVGQRARCSLAHCRQFSLERLVSLRWEKCHGAGRWGKVPAEELEWSLAPGSRDLPGLLADEKPAQKGFTEAKRIIHHAQYQHPRLVLQCTRQGT